ncbi:hypothetical protein ETH01_03100 [Enterococcus thailandicus]|uniref:Uncharacterized protein n=1 Tax=Enterococcus thailandicus TaxID=417368 RepID=A0A510W9Y1_ENTTH|nr:hypothetical protein ETH01_03100 [Enterococcus thailandicus]
MQLLREQVVVLFVLSYISPLKNFAKKERRFLLKNRNRLSLDTHLRVICTIVCWDYFSIDSNFMSIRLVKDPQKGYD